MPFFYTLEKIMPSNDLTAEFKAFFSALQLVEHPNLLNFVVTIVPKKTIINTGI